MGLKYLSIKTKLFILSIIPMFIILILSAIVLTNIFKDKKDLQITKIYIDKAEKISKIIHLLQLERALSLELLTDPKSTRVEKLKTINRELDILIQNEKEFQAILSDRKFIQLKDSSVDFIYEYYSKKISVLLDMVILIPNSINSIENRNYIQAYTYLATAKENLGRIRAVLNRAFLQKEMSREDFIKLLELSSSYNTASCRFQSSIIGFNIFF